MSVAQPEDATLADAPLKPAVLSEPRTEEKRGESPSSEIVANQSIARNQSAPITAACLPGFWADSLGNAVHVCSVDAFQARFQATLTQPLKPEVKLSVREKPGGGWLCGNATLDPTWSKPSQLHWLTDDGRISVWVRIVTYYDSLVEMPSGSQPSQWT
uniref:Uncharacterized protein n=1 Tax=Noctiluca scintillans TaxID=2966 RepID=A0A7S1AC49_NOCSC